MCWGIGIDKAFLRGNTYTLTFPGSGIMIKVNADSPFFRDFVWGANLSPLVLLNLSFNKFGIQLESLITSPTFTSNLWASLMFVICILFLFLVSQDRLDWATFRNTLEAGSLYQNQIKSQVLKEKNWKHKADQSFYSDFFSWFVWLWS